ncbi:MAG: RDD family protein [Gammaproteobacteria bacterium]|nr:RDD family protein [Gammaproteobacteria bacterium]
MNHALCNDLNIAPLWRRCAAMLYDALILIALFFIATALLLPFNDGQAIQAGNFYNQLYLLSISYVFFGWFWTHGGQTIGMRTWKIKIQNLGGASFSWLQAAERFFMALISLACGGIGFFWMLFNNKGTWQDIFSDSYIVLIENKGASD